MGRLVRGPLGNRAGHGPYGLDRTVTVTFVGNDANAWHNIPTKWHVVGTGDYNGDGRDDVLWRRDDGSPQFGSPSRTADSSATTPANSRLNAIFQWRGVS